MNYNVTKCNLNLGTRVRGGLTLREALTLCELINETGKLNKYVDENGYRSAIRCLAHTMCH